MYGELEKGDLVWFDPSIGYTLPGEVIEYHKAAQVLTVQAVIGGKPQVFTLTSLNGVRKRQDLGQNGIDDMIQLSDLNEASLLWNLKIRYDKELIYTYVGSILVAVNPYKMFDIYGLDMVKKYENQILGTLPPHLFAIGSSAYSALNKTGDSQVVVISGESGAGKTESTKLVMQYLAAVNKSPSNLVTEQILEASPLLESFGNAKTVRNDNSSRFGKYLEVHFKEGIIIGAKVTEYLLEKSRIVTQAPEERNYHVFYEMLLGLSETQKQSYGLLTPEKYFYLNQGGSCEIDGKMDKEDFQSLLSAMQVLGFTNDEQDTIFRILASVLHLGNVYFHRKQLRHGQEGVEIGSDAEIKWTAHLLKLSPDGIRDALMSKTTEARGERVQTPLSIDQSLDARDAFAKALYHTLFSWLVARINQIVYKGTKRTAAISILDIFGFEDFQENSFEQLCINYANENLQFYFNKQIFKLEQMEYVKEKIQWQTISYTDNVPIINLIAKKPVGIMHLLDDESNFPKATDVSFLEKCHYNHALDELYSRPRMSSSEFGLKHYAGQVWYNVDGFLDKNRDTLRSDVVELLISSKIKLISSMFENFRNNYESTKTINKANGRFVTMKPRTPTVAARFHDSLQQLLGLMDKCNPWFVRCIKPNNEKAPMKFDMPIVVEQLRYTGMLETIRIRKTGYPIRLKFSQFFDHFRYLLPDRGTSVARGTPYRELCRYIMEVKGCNSDDYQLGTTRIFLRENLERQLEKERSEILHKAALTLQTNIRGYLARRKYQNVKKSAVRLQAAFRGWSARRKYKIIRKGVISTQAKFRGRRQRQRYLELKEELKRRAVVEKAARDRAKVKAQKEEQERTSRAVAGVNHLEIPAELAFIFSKLDDWEQVHTERNLVKVVGNVTTMPRKYHLPQDIDYHAFTKFTNIYFKSHVWGMKREPIKTPFLAKAKDIDYQDSLAIFKLILRFMNDNNLSGKKETVLGDYIVNKGLANEKLRDEILCQLCNQTWNNTNDANNERGWLLMANCLSVFPPSGTLYKYLLKYVSDHAYDGYKALCQKKLLEIDSLELPLARSYPPNLLEWRSNRKRVNMALLVHFSDGENTTLGVDSWTTSEELAGFAVRDKGIQDWKGWSVALSFDQGLTKETTGCDYVMDLISEMEVAPAFPVCKNSFLLSQDFVVPKSNMNEDLEVPLITPRRPVNPPPQPPARKQSHELLEEAIHAPRKPLDRMRSQSKDHTMDTGLSRKSALNDRYFEDGRSRSLDNLLESELTIPRKLDDLGLSRSRLNDRYHSVDKITSASSIIESRGVSNQEYMTKAEILLEENLESVSQRGESHRAAELNGSTAGLNDNQSDVAASSSNVNIDFDYQDITARSEDDKGSYIKGHPRFIKSQYAGKRAAPGSHSSRAYIEKSDYTTKSSALSDTSEAPSLASHVRRVRVPSQASDVDQFLDDLFMPVLDGNLDELSDARSLAASIKGGGGEKKRKESVDYDADDYEVATLTNSAESHRLGRGNAENVDDYITDLFQPIFVNDSLNRLTSATTLAQTIKGGGRGVQNQTTSQPGFTPITNMTSPPPVMPGMMSPTSMMMPLFTPTAQSSASLSFLGPGGLTGTAQSMSTGNFYSASPDSMMQSAMLHSIPIYNMQGLNIPNQQVDSNLLAYQQNLQRAFLQSAMAQNIQIQQQLFAQNQALQQLLQQQSSANLSSHQQTPVSFGAENSDYWLGDKGNQSPAPPLPPKSKTFNSAIQTTTKAQIHRAPSPTQNKDRRYSFNKNGSQQTTAFTTVLTELKSRKSSQESVTSKNQGIPAPPPLPPPPDSRDPHNRSFIDSYGRAKTVRIGKWRWPPPQDENQEGSDSFLQFKLRQQRKTTPQKQSPQDIMEERGDGIEWEEFDIDNVDKASTSNRKLSAPVRKESKDHKNSFKAFEVGAQRPTPGSIGKLRISSEMRHKLEMVTANHSVRSTTKSEKPSLSQVPNMTGPKKLEDNRRLLLEQQLAGRWGSVDSIDQIARAMTKDERTELQPTNIVRSQIERMEKSSPPAQSKAQNNSWRPNPPPAPVAPPALDGIQNNPQVPSRSNSFYSTSHTPVARPRSPPPPIQPVKRNAFGSSDMFGNMRKESFGHHDFSHRPSSRRDDIFDDRVDGKDGFNNARGRENIRSSDFMNGTSVYKRKIEMDRRSSIADNMERIEIEESSEFLQPVDIPPPTPIQRQQEVAETKMHPQPNAAHFTYNRVPWKLQVRKEVFSPVEKLTNPMAVHLIFCQIVRDVLASNCIRISREQRTSMKKLLDGYGITVNTVASQNIKQTVKKNIVELAKEWGTYFCRLYPVSGGQTNRIVQYLGVSHSGIRLIRREKNVTSDYLQILETVTFDEIAETSVPKNSAVEIVLRTGGRLVLYSHRASQIQTMIMKYIVESEKGNLEYVRGVSDHIHRDPSVLSFRKGEIIKILPADHYVEKGWLYGVIGDRRGTFPCELVEPASREELINAQNMYQQSAENVRIVDKTSGGWTGKGPINRTIQSSGKTGENDEENAPAAVHDGKHSLLQFAIHHFRQSPEKFEMLKTSDGSISGSLKVIEGKSKKSKEKGKIAAKDPSEWTWKEQVDLVKFTAKPIEQSLLRLDTTELNDLAVECFVCLMRYMGDLPMPTDVSEVKCVYTILMHCHRFEQLRDEVYCQLMKQTTNNKSVQQESCQRGWRLFSIVAAYFLCSDTLKPFLFKYLETAAYDKRRAYHGTATVCLQNLRKTFKYGGRKNVPSVEEITAISAGRNSKRQIYRLPGGTEKVVNTKSTTVVQDVIEELCIMINVTNPQEMEEFSVYCIVEGDTFTMPLAREEYILDVTTELQKNHQIFCLIFCRSVWSYPLRLDSQLYVEVVFNQIAPDYLEGLLLVMPGESLEQEFIYDIAKIAALLHRAADMTHVPTMKETKFLLPKPALSIRDVKPSQWVNMVQSNWQECESITTIQAKAQFLDILSKWPLFGSSFFAIKKASEPKERTDQILALNRNGVHFIDLATHILSIFCIIYKRVTDDEANKLFYFLQKYSREWPLLNNITWEENGAIFTDITYGGFIIIVIGLIIAQASGELQHCRKMENFFLMVGALMFIASGSLELAALDSVEERLVDNAAILGVFSLLTGFVFILDFLLASKRRKKYKPSNIKKKFSPKATQTEEGKLAELYKSSDMNGNIQNSGYFNTEPLPKMEHKKTPRNGVKILPSSPALEEGSGFKIAPPVYTPNDLKTSDAKIRSTESFLRSEKGEFLLRNLTEPLKDHVYVPPGYVLMPVGQLDFKDENLSDGKRESVTPPGYATVITDVKSKTFRTPSGYMIVPIDQIDPKNEDGTRKLQSPTITTTVKSPHGYYNEEYYLGKMPQHSITNLSLSDLSDVDDRRKSPGLIFKKIGKYSPEYLHMDTKDSKYDDSVIGTKPMFFNDLYQRADSRLSHKSLQDHHYLTKGRHNQSLEDEPDDVSFQRNSSQRSSKPRVSDKPKSILRFDRVRPPSKTEDDTKDQRFDSLDSRKIAEDLRHLKEITKSEQDLTSDLEDENDFLKKRPRMQKTGLENSKLDSKKQMDDDPRNYPLRKMPGERINELEDMERLLKLEKKVRDLEEAKMKDLEDEKDRRMSEREEQYFGILDLRQSHRESSPVPRMALSDIEKKMKMQSDGEGAKKTNEKLKEKFHEQEDKAREDQDYRKIIDEGFYFIDEEERKMKNLRGSRGQPKDKRQIPGATGARRDAPRDAKRGKSPSPNGSDETPPSQTTDEEIRLRIETPSSSYRSEAQMWLGSEMENESTAPTSPGDPGYVLRTAQNWPETPSPSPQDRFRFSARKAQKLKISSETPSPEMADEEKSSKSDLGGTVTRRVDFTEVPLDEMRRPSTVMGSTSSWKKWLQPKPKFHHTKSAPT